jgi:H+/gluconate symporter-like permease
MKNHLKKLIAGVCAVALTAGAAFGFTTVLDGITLGSTTAPALTSCGTSPAIAGTDLAGIVTMGTGSPTGCVITFNTAKSAVPVCVVASQTAPATTTPAYTVSATAITWVQTGTSSNKISYICVGT